MEPGAQTFPRESSQSESSTHGGCLGQAVLLLHLFKPEFFEYFFNVCEVGEKNNFYFSSWSVCWKQIPFIHSLKKSFLLFYAPLLQFYKSNNNIFTFFFKVYILFIYLFFPFIFISWRLITLQYCSGFCHTLTWISHGLTCVPHPDAPSCLPLHPIPLGLPSAPALSTCLVHPTWAGDLFHPW